MGSKQCFYFKKMLSDAKVNVQLTRCVLDSGLVGDPNPSGQFQSQLKPAVIKLEQTSVWAQKAVVSSCKKVLEDMEGAAAVWEETMDQASPDKKW